MIKTTIHVERAKTRMTQDGLAIKAQVSRLTIHSIERGKKVPSVELALKIAKIFKVRVEDIFHLESNSSSKPKK